jgi:hypothetical protein
LQYLKETGQTEEATQYETYLKETGQIKKGPRRRIIVSDDSPEEASYSQKALGGIASLARDIPGVEALQAGARSVVRRQPYSEALSDIRGAEDAAPSAVRNYNRIAGSLPAIMATPGGAVLQGARFGAVKGLLGAEPATLEERTHDAAREGAIGAVAGKAGQFLVNTARTGISRTLGKIAERRDAQIAARDAANYGKAASEGVGVSNPAVTAALDAPDVKPFADAIRGSSIFKGADDATVLREAYKLMGEKQGTLATRAANSPDFKAGTSLEKAEIGKAKRELLDAADKIMPSFRPAVQGHAELAGERKAFQAAADATGRLINGTTVAGKNLAKRSPEAFMKSILQMTPAEAKAATEGVLGQLKAKTGIISGNPATGFGLVPSVSRINRIAPWLEALDKQAGNTVPSLLRATTMSGLLAH